VIGHFIFAMRSYALVKAISLWSPNRPEAYDS
jgi:hypothetical protein